MKTTSLAVFAAFAIALSGCDAPYDECAAPSSTALGKLPTHLSKAGLFADMQTEELADRVWLFKPRFPLWTDGAKKRRWIHVPDGKSIDVSDMDDWRFPVGTKVFKEFVRDGVRVETRILQKTGTGDADWSASAYLWNADQKDAVLLPGGGTNQLGTPHDVPGADACMGCHNGRKSRVLGFSAVQLAWDAPDEFADVATFKAAGVLPADTPEAMELPGTDLDQRALGYLHANCSHCHNQARPPTNGPRCYDPEEGFDFTIPTRSIAKVEDMPALAGGGENVITPGNANQSQAIRRMANGDPRMPPLGVEVIDTAGRTLLSDWVNSL